MFDSPSQPLSVLPSKIGTKPKLSSFIFGGEISLRDPEATGTPPLLTEAPGCAGAFA